MALVADWIMQPVGIIAAIWLAILLLWLLVYRARPWPVFVLVLLAVGIFCVFASPGFSNHVVQRIENWRVNPSFCDHDSGGPVSKAPLIVLTGGLDKWVPSTDPYQILSRDSLLRALKAYDVAKASPDVDAIFYITGGVSHKRKPAELMAQVLMDRGISAARIETESESRSTHASGLAIAARFSPETTPVLVLITSALHTSRAAAVFEKQGFKVCHVATDTLYSPAVFPVSLMPYVSGFNKSTLALRELLAITAYKLGNKI